MQTKGECFMFGLMPYERRERGMMDLFNDLDKYFFGDKSMPSMPALSCRTDIEDRGDSYLLSAELPGFSKEDIRLDLDGDVLTISAAHSGESEKKEKDGSYVCRERHYGSYSRSFDVSAIRQEEIRAAYKNGVLELTLPKKEAAPAPTARAIEIE